MPRKTARAQQAVSPASTTATPSKISGVIALLCRDDGATLAELVQVTGWQPHTMRAALTGLRNKGHAIDKSQREGVTHYRINEAR